MGNQTMGYWEELEPSDGSPRHCLLGRHIQQRRRLRDLACFNGKDWEWEDQTITKCECSLVRPALHVQLSVFRC